LGEWRYSSVHSLTLALDGGDWSTSRSGHFTSGKRARGNHLIRSWVGLRACLDAVIKKKFFALLGIETRSSNT